ERRMAVMQELHMVDMLAQHITAITDFTARLAAAAAAGEGFDVDRALGAITLGTVADRMREAIIQKSSLRPVQTVSCLAPKPDPGKLEPRASRWPRRPSI
ncbi:hypothetical protein CSW58_11430, partial [Caulobacter sp. B11]